MKANIDTKNIGNRKFILELRFDHKVTMLDKKGALVESFQNANIFSVTYWEIGQSDITIRDHEDKEKAKNIVQITLNRLNYNSFQIDSVESFYAKFVKIRKAVEDILGNLNNTRIGSRIIGTYFTKSKDYTALLDNFKKAFPAKFLIEEYPAKDFFFRLDYQNGMYQIGPLAEEDDFYRREFNIDGCKTHVGVVIDTDNYLTNVVKDINDPSLVKDVYKLSLSVEKDLFSNLKDF